MITKFHGTDFTCGICKGTVSGNIYLIYLVKKLKDKPQKTYVCPGCICEREFWFLDDTGNLKFNFLKTIHKSTLSDYLEKTVNS